MTGNRYEFRNRWAVDAAPDSAYLVLAALDRYPRWWPEVREVTKVSDQAYQVRARSLLPYDLIFVTHQGTRDPVNRVLEARLTGDLEGYAPTWPGSNTARCPQSIDRPPRTKNAATWRSGSANFRSWQWGWASAPGSACAPGRRHCRPAGLAWALANVAGSISSCL